jgi:hypothetical protein
MIARHEPINRLHAALSYRPPVRPDRCNDPRIIERYLRTPARVIFNFEEAHHGKK